MKKKPTLAKLRDKLKVQMQKYVRLAAADEEGVVECVTCGKRDHWSRMQGGHFIGARCVRWRCELCNIHPQCPGCNGPNNSNGVQIKYALWMMDRYGIDRVRGMVDEMGRGDGLTRDDLESRIAAVKQKNKELAERLPSDG